MVTVSRVQTGLRVERNLLKVLKGLAEYLDLSLGDLVEGIAQVFPAVRTSRIIGTYAGVRPTLYAYGPNEDKLSRDHRIVDHRIVQPVDGWSTLDRDPCPEPEHDPGWPYHRHLH